MSDNISIAYIQHDIAWKSRDKNLSAYDDYINDLNFTPDIILLPETYNTGFCVDDIQVAEKMNGHSTAWMKQKSKEVGSVIAGSVFIEDGHNYFNRFLWVSPDESIEYYDKRHLFSMGREHELFTAGSQRKIVDFNGWKICLNICYDLRFPVWSRNIEGYDILIYIANWPSPRSNAWRDLLKARAIENMCYCIGVNRIGIDGYGHDHQGDSAFISPLGEIIYTSMERSEIAKNEFELHTLKEIRERLPFLGDRDEFSIIK